MATLIFWCLVAVLFVWFNVTTEAERGRAWCTLVVVFFLSFGILIAGRFVAILVIEGPIAALKMFGGESPPLAY